MAVPASVTPPPAVVISLPGEIDLNNAGDVLALITAAFGPGVAVVIADLTTTRFCDSAGLRHLLQARQHASDAGVQLRLVIPPSGPVSRVIELTGISRHVAVYPRFSSPLVTACPMARTRTSEIYDKSASFLVAG